MSERSSRSTTWTTKKPADHGRESGNETMKTKADGSHQIVRQPPYLLQDADALTSFRILIGITPLTSQTTQLVSPASHSAVEVDQRAAPNLGLYARVVHHETRARSLSKGVKMVVYTCLALEMSIAAALTALGAGKISYIAITTLGAVNTVVAGLLAYLEGGGYLQKLESEAKEWEAIREFIEQREREFARNSQAIDVPHTVQDIEDMYEEAKEEIDAANTTGHVSAMLKDFQKVGHGDMLSGKRRHRRLDRRTPDNTSSGAPVEHADSSQRAAAPDSFMEKGRFAAAESLKPSA